MYAQRRPSLLRLLANEDELFFLVSAWLHRSSLVSGDAAFSEGLYGLHRVPVGGSSPAETGGEPARLTKTQRTSTLALLVGEAWSMWDVGVLLIWWMCSAVFFCEANPCWLPTRCSIGVRPPKLAHSSL